MRSRLLRLGSALALGATALAGAGCGGSAARAEGGHITLTAREYAELPRHVEAAPGPLRITLRNAGVQDHDLAIRRGDETVAHLKAVPPGASATLTVDLRPGAYDLECTEWRHAQLGEHAQLTVR